MPIPIEYLVCPTCGKNGPRLRRDGREACDFPVSRDTPLVYVRESRGGRIGMFTTDVITLAQAKKLPEYQKEILRLRAKAQQFLLLTS